MLYQYSQISILRITLRKYSSTSISKTLGKPHRHLKRIAQEIGETLTDDELKEITEEADRDEDGYIGFEDFYK